jgi:hypothetical protein
VGALLCQPPTREKRGEEEQQYGSQPAKRSTAIN